MANIKKTKKATIKTKTGGQYSYTYTDLATVNSYIESIGEKYYQYIDTLANAVTGELVDYIYTVRIDKEGKESKPIRGCRIMQSQTTISGNIAQEYNSGITYARRYSLCLAYGLATEDDDGNSAGGTKAEITSISRSNGNLEKMGDIKATSKQLAMLEKLLKRELTEEEKKYTLKQASDKIRSLLNENNTDSIK